MRNLIIKIAVFILSILFIVGVFVVIGFEMIDIDDWIDKSNILQCNRHLTNIIGHSSKHSLVWVISIMLWIAGLVSSIVLDAYLFFDNDKI